MSLPFIPTSEVDQSTPEDTGYRSPLDLNKLLITSLASTFFMRAGVDKYDVVAKDILVVDRSLTPQKQQLVIVPSGEGLILARYPAPEVWGVVTYVIHKTW